MFSTAAARASCRRISSRSSLNNSLALRHQPVGKSSLSLPSATSFPLSKRPGQINCHWKSSKSSSNGNKKDLPPLPPKQSPSSSNNNSTPSPMQARDEYLKADKKVSESINPSFGKRGNNRNANAARSPSASPKNNTDGTAPVEEPFAKMERLQNELAEARKASAEKIEKELNKSMWYRFTSPIRRYRHSMINVGAVLLAYILAHNLYVNAKQKSLLQNELEVSNQKLQELQTVLQSLLKEETVQKIVQKAVSAEDTQNHDMDEKSYSSSASISSSWFGFGGNRSYRRRRRHQLGSDDNDDDDISPNAPSSKLSKSLERSLRQAMEETIGDKAFTDEQLQQKSIQRIWKTQQDTMKQQKGQTQQQQLLQNEEKLVERDETKEMELLVQQAMTSPSSSSPDVDDGTDSNDPNKPRRRQVFSM